MKYLTLTILACLTFTVSGQTAKLENDALFKHFQENKISQKDYASKAKKWTKTLKRIKRYPDLPLDKDSVVRFTYVSEFTNTDKEQLYNRTLEWLSINYGLYPSFIYTNKEDGRIIFDNNYSISSNYTGFYTGIITIINQKVVLEITNITFQSFFAGHYSGDKWVPDQTTSLGVAEIYPIALKDSYQWELYLKLFASINQQAYNTVGSLRDFHTKYKERYPF